MVSDNTVLKVDNVYAGYGAVRVLQGVSVKLNKGEVTVLLGTNGNGKSTLLKCIAGIVTPTSGSINLKLNGENIILNGKAPDEVVKLGVCLVPEGRRLFPKLTVEENLTVGAYRKGARKNIKENLEIVYSLFPILKERKTQLAGTLSGGEQQMLAIARGLMSNPKILLIDEPSLGLAPILVSRVMSKIKELKEHYGLTIFMAEQNLYQATKIADRGYIMVHGKIEFEGDTEQLREHELVKRYYLGG